jgi:hypothetical protein
MARKNRYRGVLRPLQVGRGSPEVSLVLIYDVEEDRIRTRVADICLDYGLERIQFSAFFGRLNRNRRQELALRVQAEIGNRVGAGAGDSGLRRRFEGHVDARSVPARRGRVEGGGGAGASRDCPVCGCWDRRIDMSQIR